MAFPVKPLRAVKPFLAFAAALFGLAALAYSFRYADMLGVLARALIAGAGLTFFWLHLTENSK